MRAAKARGESPEQVIAALKRHTSPAILAERPGRHHELVSLVLHWCLDEYYYYGPRAGDTSGQSPTPAAEQSAATA